MRYICCQPSNIYYSWQVDTMIYSFVNNGINQEEIDIVFSIKSLEDNPCLYLLDKYPNVNFYFYPDTRKSIKYISSIRPYTLKKHFYKYPDLYKGTFMYHDCDIALTKPLEIDNYLCGCDQTCYLSDTISYIGHNYILSKGQDVLDLMCSVVNIDKEIVKQNEENSGGAQNVLKNIDYTFWEEVEIDCENLFYEVVRLNIKKVAEDDMHHPLQIWCADMWAVLWNVWKDGKETRITDDLDFMFATNNASDWEKKPIFHNAGVVSSANGLFYKGNYVNSLPTKDLVIDKEKASYKYYEMLKEVL